MEVISRPGCYQHPPLPLQVLADKRQPSFQTWGQQPQAAMWSIRIGTESTLIDPVTSVLQRVVIKLASQNR